MSPTSELLLALVEVDSTNPPGNEVAVARVLSDWLYERGIDSEVDEFEPGRANLVARVHGTGDGRGPRLMFNTHLDVVPAGGGWDTGPFAPVERDGAVYGRGAADAKGSLAAMAACLAWFAERADRFVGTLELSGVADEEVGSRGARRLLGRERPDLAIIGEPTELRLMAAHKGSLRPVVEVIGRSSHAAQPDLGVNAAEGAALLLGRLPGLRNRLAAKAHPLVGAPTVVPVLIAGGEALNMVPEACRITFDRRMVPGETAQELIDELEELFLEIRVEHPTFDARIVDTAPSTGGPSETPASHDFVRACQTGLADIGLPVELGGLVVNCDMTHFRARGVPTVVCGPGSPGAMHARNEHLGLAQLDQAVEAYRSMASHVLACHP